MAQVITRVTRDEAYIMLEDRIWELDEHDNINVLIEILKYGDPDKGWHQMADEELSDHINRVFSDTTYEVVDSL